jgi:uncharacterized membrane protein YeaQ/YmgE (transglycosylase-associated protein family)
MSTVRTAIRVIAATLAIIFSVMVAFKAPGWVRFGALDAIRLFIDSPLLLLATACWIAAFSDLKRAGYSVLFGLLSGVALGAIAGILGFFGPLVFMPQSNQGPLFGIFIAGPLGFVGGMIGGAIYSAWRPPQRKLNQAVKRARVA